MVSNPHTGLVTYNVLVGDSATLSAADELPNTVAVQHVEVFHEIDRIPEAILTVVDGDVAAGEFAVSDSDALVPGKHIEVKVGFDTDNQTVFKGIIVSIRHTISNGTSRLKVACKHEAVKMTVSKKSKHYEELADSDLISELLSENGLSGTSVSNTDTVHEQLLQAQVTDWDFMLSRADGNGMHCFADHDGIAIKPIDTGADAVVDLRYGRDIFELDTELDARRQYPAVETSSWNYTDQEVQQVEGEGEGAEEHGRLAATTLAQ